MRYLFHVGFFFLGTVCLVCFGISLSRDRRRLRNGVYLTVALFFLACGALSQFASSVPLLGPIFVVGLVFVLLPLLMLVLAVSLIVNGVTMMRREGRRLGNLLSLFAGLGMLAVPVTAISLIGTESTVLRGALVSAILVLGYVSFLFTCFLVYSLVYGRMPSGPHVDFIVLLGSGLLNSKVPPLLASRLDRGLDVFRAQGASGEAPLLITSGGQGPDEDVSESRAMADYLVAQGAPPGRILLEEQSRTTEENLRFSKQLMTEHKPDHRCLIVTNNFHAFRAALMARAAEVNGQVIGSPTARYYWPSATIREFVGVFMARRGLNFTVCAALALLVPFLMVTV